eukprot:scaffold48108_cov30-Tisochrysis_lutea.AAC.1
MQGVEASSSVRPLSLLFNRISTSSIRISFGSLPHLSHLPISTSWEAMRAGKVGTKEISTTLEIPFILPALLPARDLSLEILFVPPPSPFLPSSLLLESGEWLLLGCSGLPEYR